MAKDALYFSHDQGARNDEKMLALRSELGWEGIGLYWGLVEMLSEATDYKLSLKRIKAFAAGFGISKEKLEHVLNTCLTDPVNLFKSDNERFWSESLLRRMELKNEIRSKRSKAGIISGQKRKEKATCVEHVLNNENERNENETKGNELKTESRERAQGDSISADNSIDKNKDFNELYRDATEEEINEFAERFAKEFTAPKISDLKTWFTCSNNKRRREIFCDMFRMPWIDIINEVAIPELIRIRDDKNAPEIKNAISYFNKGIVSSNGEPYLIYFDGYKKYIRE